MQFVIPVIFSTLLVAGIRCEADPLSGNTKDGHYEYLQAFHHGRQQHHPSVDGGADVGSAGGSPSGVGHPVGVNTDQSTAVTQDQIAHQTVGQVGGHQGQIPVVHSAVPPYVHKVESPYFGRAIGPAYPYVYGKTYASPYYAPYQAASPYSGYYQSGYPYHYSASPYSASPYSAHPYSSSAYPGQVGGYSGQVGGYSGYSGYPGYQGGASNYGYVPPSYYPGYSPYYQQSNEVQQSPNKQ